MTIATPRIPSVRLAPDNAEVLRDLGPLANLVGTWEGRGFNLIARPDFHDQANLYLQLNQTHENFRVSPIGSAIPNRGFGQDDINLFGVDYLQKIHDEHTGGALHLEPGLWVIQPGTTFPPKENPNDPPRIVHRMGSIPHGNALLASGTATPFTGPPTLPANGTPYNGSVFPSFNSTPFGAGGPLNAAGSSDAGTAAANPGVVAAFGEYDLTDPPGPGNPLGTRWMGISSPGVGIHGTPDSASLGYSASHGCIRMAIPQAEWLFDHVAVGTPVYIVAS